MQSKTSSTNKSKFIRAIIAENLRHLWPLLIVCILLLFLTAIVPLILSGSQDRRNDTIELLLQGRHPSLFCFVFIIPLTSAVAIYRYLHTQGSAISTHALPFSRGTLFIGNTISGIIFSAVPFILLYLCILPYLSQMAGNTMIDTPALSWCFQLITILITVLFIYALSTLAGIITGTTILHLLTAIALNFILPITISMISSYSKRFLVGYSNKIPYRYFHPLFILFSADTFTAMVLGLHAIAAIAMLILSILLYKKLKLERIGDSVTFSGFEHVISHLVSFTGLILSGMLFYSIIGEKTALYAGIILGGIITFFIVRMIMQKTLNVFNLSTMKSFGIFTLIGMIFVACICMDVTGYSTRRPPISRSDRVAVSLLSSELLPCYRYKAISTSFQYDTPEAMKLAADLHTHMQAVDLGRKSRHPYFLHNVKSDEENPNSNYIEITFSYYNGKLPIMKRQFDGYFSEPVIRNFINSKEFREAITLKQQVDLNNIQSICIDLYSTIIIRNNIIDHDSYSELIKCIDQDLISLPSNELLYQGFTDQLILVIECDSSVFAGNDSTDNTIDFAVTKYFRNTLKWLETHGYIVAN